MLLKESIVNDNIRCFFETPVFPFSLVAEIKKNFGICVTGYNVWESVLYIAEEIEENVIEKMRFLLKDNMVDY